MNTDNKNNCLKLKTKFAFTLAEVLITLGIIGVVAALTIPMLISDIQMKHFKAGYKKIYSELNSVSKSLIDEYGELYADVCPTQFDDVCLAKLFASKMKVDKFCNSSTVTQGCQHKFKFLDGKSTYTIGNATYNADANWPGFVTGTGYSLTFRFHSTSYVSTVDGKIAWGWMTIDVNGEKAPNTVGKDIYYVRLLDFGQIAPMVYHEESISIEDLKQDCYHGSGVYCSKLFLLEK